MLDYLDVSWSRSTAKHVPPCQFNIDEGDDATDMAIT